MGKKKKLSYPVPTYVPKSKGVCGGCGQPVYKRPVRYKGSVWHSVCLVKAVREGKV